MSKPVDFKFDTRIRERMLRRGELAADEVTAHLQALPDLDGEFETMTEFDQPAVTPARIEAPQEPIIFEGIHRLHALADAAAPPAAAPEVASPEPFRSALAGSMESQISGVGAGAVSAALGALAAESAGGFESLGQSPFAPLAQAVAAEAAAAQAAADAASLAASVAAAPEAAAPIAPPPVAPAAPVPPVSPLAEILGASMNAPQAPAPLPAMEAPQAPAPVAPPTAVPEDQEDPQ